MMSNMSFLRVFGLIWLMFLFTTSCPSQPPQEVHVVPPPWCLGKHRGAEKSSHLWESQPYHGRGVWCQWDFRSYVARGSLAQQSGWGIRLSATEVTKQNMWRIHQEPSLGSNPPCSQAWRMGLVLQASGPECAESQAPIVLWGRHLQEVRLRQESWWSNPRLAYSLFINF